MSASTIFFVFIWPFMVGAGIGWVLGHHHKRKLEQMGFSEAVFHRLMRVTYDLSKLPGAGAVLARYGMTTDDMDDEPTREVN